MTSPALLHIIDDDPSVRDSLSLLLQLHGYETATYPCADAFLAACTRGWAGCILADLRMPGRSGLELQAALQARGIPLPLIIITAHGDVSAARTSLKAGAVDFLEKPLDTQQLLAAVNAALERERARLVAERESARVHALLERLTGREREVLREVLAGRHNREIAELLGISARTAEAHKARVMAKLGVQRLPDLVRLLQHHA
jgi:RNA polymerase sigma factor (sigma-70 family)